MAVDHRHPLVFDYDALPNGRQKLWEGEDGIVLLLVRNLPFEVDPRTVRTVMTAVHECVRLQVEYDPRRKLPGEGKTMGPSPYIALNTRYARIIADTIEAGLGIRTALANVNAALLEDGTMVGPPGKQVSHVGYSAVLNCYHSMKPVVTSIKKRKQGSSDTNSDWAKACHRFPVQLCVRFGEKPHARLWGRSRTPGPGLRI